MAGGGWIWLLNSAPVELRLVIAGQAWAKSAPVARTWIKTQPAAMSLSKAQPVGQTWGSA